MGYTSHQNTFVFSNSTITSTIQARRSSRKQKYFTFNSKLNITTNLPEINLEMLVSMNTGHKRQREELNQGLQ